MKSLQLATFGGGCFWCVEAIILRIKGVENVVSGYAGGASANPTYREVCSGRSGHAEVIQVNFDENEISYKDLLTIFMTSHNPTTLNQQGADRGTQYRSTIMYHNENQMAIAHEVLNELKDSFDKPIVTEVVPLKTFYPAEAYHQEYYDKNPNGGYCRVVIDPKISKLRMQYADKLKDMT